MWVESLVLIQNSSELMKGMLRKVLKAHEGHVKKTLI